MAEQRATNHTPTGYRGIALGVFTNKLDPDNLPSDFELGVEEGYYRVRNYTDSSDGVEKTIHEEIFKEISGMITAVEVTTPPFGGLQMTIILEDEGEIRNIQCAYKKASGVMGPYASSFIQRIPAIDLSQPVMLKPYHILDKERSTAQRERYNTGISVFQMDGDIWRKLPTAYNAAWNEKYKDEPEKVCPEPVLKKDEFGVERWDFTERNRFMHARMEEFMQAVVERRIPVTQEESETTKGDAGAETEDDLPF